MYLIRRATRLPTALLFQPTRRSYSKTRQLPIELETFGRLAPWATQNLSSDSFISVLIRHHEHRPYNVQRALLSQITTREHPPTPIRDSTLDLTSFETTSSLIFLFWLFNRRLPDLSRDCILPSEEKETAPVYGSETELHIDNLERAKHTRLQNETFTLGLIDAWRLGLCLSVPKFQNDILILAAMKLEKSERSALSSDNPHYSFAVKWARQAFDGLSPSPMEVFDDAGEGGRPLREFAVDVAAKRVYDVGMKGLVLTESERENLGNCPKFATGVFGDLGGLIGTKGVRVVDLAGVYLVDEGVKK